LELTQGFLVLFKLRALIEFVNIFHLSGKIPAQLNLSVMLNQKGVKMRILIIMSLLVMISCAPAIRTTVFQSYSPKPHDYPIKIYRHKMPTCEFEELGLVNSMQRNRFISMDEVMNSLLSEARRIGGDAIIGLNETNLIHKVTKYGVKRYPVLSGTVIRFTNEECKK